MGAAAIMSLSRTTRPVRPDRDAAPGVARRLLSDPSAIADLLEAYPKDEAIEDPGDERDRYERAPWLRELDLLALGGHEHRRRRTAIREVTRDVSISDRELLRKVEAPVLLICREGDSIHPAELGRSPATCSPTRSWSRSRRRRS